MREWAGEWHGGDLDVRDVMGRLCSVLPFRQASHAHNQLCERLGASNDELPLQQLPSTKQSQKGRCPFGGAHSGNLKILGMRHGTTNVYSKDGLETTAGYPRGENPDRTERCTHTNGSLTETTVFGYTAVKEELSSMAQREAQGLIQRTFDLGENHFANTRFWTSVPGLRPHHFVLG
eukprot:scaffold32757_cov67-Phaeocystis_antarctica.AAC.1